MVNRKPAPGYLAFPSARTSRRAGSLAWSCA